MKESQIVEINGVKLEVDMRTAKRVDTFRVGTRVKLLIKNSYRSEPTIHSGVIIGFEDFKSAPTIVVAYMESAYSAEIKIANINAYSSTNDDTKYEIIADNDNVLLINKTDVLDTFDRQRRELLEKLRENGRKKRLFLSRFGHTFGETRDEIREQLEVDRNDEDSLVREVLAEQQ